MNVAIGADHAGFAAKEEIKAVIRALGHVPVDKGTASEISVDYPDFAQDVSKSILSGEAERGVLICGTGIGMSIAANRNPGIRAALICSEQAAELSRRHNDANVFCAGARLTPIPRIAELLKIWLSTPFEAGRHQRRVDKLK